MVLYAFLAQRQSTSLLMMGSRYRNSRKAQNREISSVGLEHCFYTARVIGSNPVFPTNGYQSGTRLSETGGNGDNKIGNWGYRIVAIAADCKSALIRVRWFESIYPHISGCRIMAHYSFLPSRRRRFDSSHPLKLPLCVMVAQKFLVLLV